MIRFGSITMHSFKNVDCGTITFPEFNNFLKGNATGSDIVGIYGPNGSGKTAVIEACAIVKDLMAGEPLGSETHDYLPSDGDSFTIDVIFLVDQSEGVVLPNRSMGSAPDSNPLWRMEYSVTVNKDDVRGFYLAHERITSKNISSGSVKSTLLDVCVKRTGETIESLEYSPTSDWSALFAGRRELKDQMNVQLHLANERSQSMIFSKGVFNVLMELQSGMSEKGVSKIGLRALQKTLNPFIGLIPEIAFNAIENMEVLRTVSHAEILFDYLRIRPGASSSARAAMHQEFRVDLLRPSALHLNDAMEFKGMIEDINKVLAVLIPGFQLFVNDLGEETLEDGSRGVRIEVLSQRGRRRIPLRCESEGIKKLVSIADLLVGVYNNPSAFLAIDELDSGVFEYLLGQIVETFDKYAQGQLLFTAHNLCPLEKLSAKSIVFTTSNPLNRYVRLTGIKSNNNLRDVYLREVELGGQDEQVYERTNRYEIDDAFYQAGLSRGERRGVKENA